MVRPRGHKQRKLNDMFIHFFCFCSLVLTITMNFDMSKTLYCLLYVVLYPEKKNGAVLFSKPILWNYCTQLLFT